MVQAYASLAMICGLVAAVLPAQCQEIRVIVRGDDLGMTQGSLTAFEKAMNSGVLTTAGIIVPGPWFEAAAKLARRNPGWCTGVHLCLVGEWRGFRWRPVLPWDKLRSVVDADGYFHTSPRALFAARPKLEEIDAELRAQIELAKKRGVNVQYLDLHYVPLTQYPGLEGLVKKIGSDYDLPLSGQLGEKRTPSIYNAPIEEKLPRAVQMLRQLEPGLWLWVCHVGADTPEQRALIHTEPEHIFVHGGVGRHRAEELNVLTSLEVQSAILQKGIVLTNYRELWRKKR